MTTGARMISAAVRLAKAGWTCFRFLCHDLATDCSIALRGLEVCLYPAIIALWLYQPIIPAPRFFGKFSSTWRVIPANGVLTQAFCGAGARPPHRPARQREERQGQRFGNLYRRTGRTGPAGGRRRPFRPRIKRQIRAGRRRWIPEYRIARRTGVRRDHVRWRSGWIARDKSGIPERRTPPPLPPVMNGTKFPPPGPFPPD